MKVGNLFLKMRKDDFIASPALRGRRILGGKLRSIKNSQNILKIFEDE